MVLLQATDHDGEHGGDGETTVGQMVADEIATVPEQESVATEDDEVSSAESHSFSETCLVTELLSCL